MQLLSQYLIWSGQMLGIKPFSVQGKVNSQFTRQNCSSGFGCLHMGKTV